MKIVIVGAGPTGLGASCRLNELGHTEWTVCERANQVGGLSSSRVDPAGFTWDLGGHVLFSHFDYFDQAVEKALQGQYFEHMRESWVRILDGWVPYPFQNNIRYLPAAARDLCVEGLKELAGAPESAANFKEWMEAVFGEGIVRYFMQPYNFKVWATPAELMSKDWIAERVSVVDLARIEKNIAEKKDDISWGPNNMFRFPRKGGTGAIYTGISRGFQGNIRFEHDLARVDLTNRLVTFSNGECLPYEKLVSTLPVDQLIAKCSEVPESVRAAAAGLSHNSVYVVGIGLRGRRTDSKCWMYFPEDNAPFYRVTNFHNYSPFNVPGGDVEAFSALMCETSYSPHKPVSRERIVEETIQGLIRCGILEEADRNSIVSRNLIDISYAYPVPTIGRDAALGVIQPFLESHDIYSRGRFGAWKYEIGNMDHCFMQGVEVVDRLLNGIREKVYQSQH